MSSPQPPPPRRKNISVFAAMAFGLAVSAAAILLISVLGPLAKDLLPSPNKKGSKPLRASCANNLKQLGLVCKMFANESRGEVYPELSGVAGQLMFSPNPVYPEYLTDLYVMMCPSDSTSRPIIDDHSYFYLGYAIKSESEMAAFAAAYETHLYNGNRFVDDLPVSEGTGSAGGDTIFRLREGVERVYITEISNPGAAARIQSSIPIMIERPENHEPTGGNVLFMDGHVEFISYPGKWPMTEKTIGLLESMGGK